MQTSLTGASGIERAGDSKTTTETQKSKQTTAIDMSIFTNESQFEIKISQLMAKVIICRLIHF